MIAGSPRSRTPSRLWCVATTTTTTPSSGGVARASSTRRPALLRVCGLRVLVMPFSRRRGAHTRSPMPGCDVLLTHSPPKFLLGQVLQWRECDGSTLLRHAVEQSLAPPQLWICGHVHEARARLPGERGRRAEDPRAEGCQRERRARRPTSPLRASPTRCLASPRMVGPKRNADQRLLAVGAGSRTGARCTTAKASFLYERASSAEVRAEMRKAAAAWSRAASRTSGALGDDHPATRVGGGAAEAAFRRQAGDRVTTRTADHRARAREGGRPRGGRGGWRSRTSRRVETRSSRNRKSTRDRRRPCGRGDEGPDATLATRRFFDVDVDEVSTKAK